MKVGIVLSGGGIRGIAHLGVLKAFKNLGIQFHHVSGTSAGAIAGAFYCSGIDPEYCLDIFLKTKLWKFVRPSLGSLGIVNIEKTGDLLKEYFAGDRIEDLNTKLTVCATDFSAGRVEYFESGNLIKTVLASSCIPGVFKPIQIHNKLYVDGGVLNNFPVEPLRKDCDFILGSSCNHLNTIDQVLSIRDLMTRAGLMSINRDMQTKLAYINILVEPKGIGSISTFDMKRAEEVYWLAYEETLQTIKRNPVLKKLSSL